MNRYFNCACLQYKTTSDKLGGKPNPFRVYQFIIAFIDTTVLVAILYTSRGHNNIGINMCCWHTTFNLPCNERRSILLRPSWNVLDIFFAWIISFKNSSNQCPKYTECWEDTSIVSSTIDYTTNWNMLECGIAMEGSVLPIVFVLAMKLLLKVTENNAFIFLAYWRVSKAIC